MRIGLVSYWFNRGQATVGRHLRSAFDQLGHATFVLARPTTDTFIRAAFVDDADVWRQPNVEPASRFEIPAAEYQSWARRNQLDVVFFFQNYQFDEISALRQSGVRTVGTFMRETFGSQHAAGARDAYSDIYSLTPSDRARFNELALTNHFVPWGCHPETIFDTEPSGEHVLFMFPGGYLSARKPVLAVIDAFRRLDRPEARLLIKVQSAPGNTEPLHLRELFRWRELRRRLAQSRAGRATITRLRRQSARERTWVDTGSELIGQVQTDSRIRLELGDVSNAEYTKTLGSCDVCVTPARWEGLGLHLYEATAAGLPLVVNDLPPMNEIVVDGRNGIVVRGQISGATNSGAEIHEVSVNELAAAMARACDPTLRQDLRDGAVKRRAELDWNTTVQALADLLAH